MLATVAFSSPSIKSLKLLAILALLVPPFRKEALSQITGSLAAVKLKLANRTSSSPNWAVTAPDPIGAAMVTVPILVPVTIALVFPTIGKEPLTAAPLVITL